MQPRAPHRGRRLIAVPGISASALEPDRSVAEQVRMADTASPGVRELDFRSSDGIRVVLLWRERDNRVILAVEDSRTGDSFTVDVHPDDSALDAFHHPYAYAAWRGVAMSATGARVDEMPAPA